MTDNADFLEVDIRTRSKWRAWLQKHHTTSAGVWLVMHKKHTGVKCVIYDDAVREALCFGWIDSLERRIDEARYALKFSPRKPRSNWAASKRKRWAELKAEGLLAPAGLAAAPSRERSKITGPARRPGTRKKLGPR